MLVQSSKRDRADREELAARILRALPRDGTREPHPGLQLHRQSKVGVREYAFLRPAFCLVAQGSKEMLLGASRFRFDPAHYLITTMELPLVTHVATASPARPYLSCKIALDPAVVTSVAVESGLVSRGAGGRLAIDVSPVEANLLDAALRLVRLIERPDEYRVLAPLIIREIVYRLLAGAQGHRIAYLLSGNSRAHRVTRAVDSIRANFAKPLRIRALARELGMSVSGFHAHFKAMTAMSPLQFQKQLRLEEARRLLLSEHVDAAEVGYRVGYDDPSHFSREYKRHFGEPPVRDIKRLLSIARACRSRTGRRVDSR